MSAPRTRLQQDLTSQIIRLIHDQGLNPGARIAEHRLAKDLGVSRTPVRSALSALTSAGYLERIPNKGMVLVAKPPPQAEAPVAERTTDELLIRIAKDRNRGRLADDVSEAELMQRYKLGRQSVREALSQLAELSIIERKPGYGWRFVATFNDEMDHIESYRFRMIVETAAILEPNFKLDPHWTNEMRAQHDEALSAALSGTWQDSSSVTFFEMNAAFHAGLGAASGNRYLMQSIGKQNQLRRFLNYEWEHGPGRVVVNCRQHMEILDRIEAGDHDVAAVLMRKHLELASLLKPKFSEP